MLLRHHPSELVSDSPPEADVRQFAPLENADNDDLLKFTADHWLDPTLTWGRHKKAQTRQRAADTIASVRRYLDLEEMAGRKIAIIAGAVAVGVLISIGSAPRDHSPAPVATIEAPTTTTVDPCLAKVAAEIKLAPEVAADYQIMLAGCHQGDSLVDLLQMGEITTTTTEPQN